MMTIDARPTRVEVALETVEVGPVRVFYREAGDRSNPTVLLLHGFPSSSHMFRDLIPLLADRYHVVAPDMPGFGFTEAPERGSFTYDFDHLAEVIAGFTDTLGLERYAIYVFDYGAPVGFRLAMTRPERITAIVTQNGNAYEEGLGDDWGPIRQYWQNPSQENRDALRFMLTLEGTRWQYVHGVPDPTKIAPEAYWLDYALLSRPGNQEIQLDLFLDYRSNVVLYPRFQDYFAAFRPPLLAAWGQHDPFFLPPGAEAFRRHNPDAQVHLLDTGHFALETHVTEIAKLMRDFLGGIST
jgi:pimeloyl-ACP methyl ester carboxylesterase